MKDKIMWLLLFLSISIGATTAYLVWDVRAKAMSLDAAHVAIEQRVAAIDTTLNSHLAQPTTPTATAPVTTPWDDALKALPACGAAEQPLPDKTSLETLGFKGIMGKGYEPAVVCRDATSGLVAFIMAKEVLTKPTPDVAETCVGSCDRDALGVLNPMTKVLKYVESGKKLGIHGEAYDQYCLIDKAMTKSSGETMLFYCGSGESGGLSHWYNYEVNGDKLVEVQTLKSLQPQPTYDIKEPSMLDEFSRKTQ